MKLVEVRLLLSIPALSLDELRLQLSTPELSLVDPDPRIERAACWEVYLPVGRLILQQKCLVRGGLQYEEDDKAGFSKDTYSYVIKEQSSFSGVLLPSSP